MTAGFDNGPRLLVAGNPAIETAIESSLRPANTLSWPTRAVVCRKDGGSWVGTDGAAAG
jgi:hypothetical protein